MKKPRSEELPILTAARDPIFRAMFHFAVLSAARGTYIFMNSGKYRFPRLLS